MRVPSSNGSINKYVRIVEAYREHGKVRQRIIADLGRRDVLSAMLPKLRRVLEGGAAVHEQGEQAIRILDSYPILSTS